MTATTSTDNECDDYLAISVSMLLPERLQDISLYTRGEDEKIKLFRGPDYPITQQDLDRAQRAGVKRLYISSRQTTRFQTYLRENLTELLANEELSVTQRFRTLSGVVREVLCQAFESNDLDATLEQTEWIGAQTAAFMCRCDVVSSDMLGVMYHDYYTFTHSTNVAALCTLLAKHLGISSEQELQQIAKGGLLHDLGKLEIPDAILTKPGRLDDDEMAQMRRHPALGFRRMAHRPELTWGQLMMVYQHHERMDGSGYPVGISGEEIHPWAQICMITDVFEALTATRPYRQRLSRETALEIMERSPSAFDEEMYRCWRAIITQPSSS